MKAPQSHRNNAANTRRTDRKPIKRGNTQQQDHKNTRGENKSDNSAADSNITHIYFGVRYLGYSCQQPNHSPDESFFHLLFVNVLVI